MTVIAPDFIAITPQALTAAGFRSVRYPGQEGTFFRRDTRVESMPYLGKQTDDEYIFGSCIACTEVYPDGRVTLSIPETSYLEESVAADSEDGQGVLRDAMRGDFCSEEMDEARVAVPAELAGVLKHELERDSLRYLVQMYWLGRADKIPTHLLPLLAWVTFNCLPETHAPRQVISYQFEPNVVMFNGMDHASALDMVLEAAVKAIQP